MTAKPQVIVKGRKFDQVLQGARTVFMRDGFERASVDDIAKEAGVSKATLTLISPTNACCFWKLPRPSVAVRPKRQRPRLTRPFP